MTKLVELSNSAEVHVRSRVPGIVNPIFNLYKQPTIVNSVGTVRRMRADLGEGTSLSFSHTVNEGDKRLLIVTFSTQNDCTISTVNWNGTSLTNLVRIQGSTNIANSVWYLINPEVGTYNISFTMNIESYGVAGAICFSNVNQSIPFESYTTAMVNQGTSTPTITVNNSTSTNLVFGCMAHNGRFLQNSSYDMDQLYRDSHAGNSWEWTNAAASKDGDSGGVTFGWDIEMSYDNTQSAIIAMPLRR
jgi:hypothetical protein